MFGKLQKILFEDEDDSEDIVEEEEPQKKPEPVKAAPVPEKKPIVIERVQPAEEPKQASMQRIDITRPMETVKEEKKPEPRFESVFAEPEPKKPSINITVDDAPKKAKPVKPSKTEEKTAPVYEFQPPISPIFGVDEKDLTALKTTTTKLTAKDKKDILENTSPIISPIFGVVANEKTSAAKQQTVEKTVERPASYKAPAVNKPAAAAPAEDDIPEFSLDDILQAGDDSFVSEKQNAAMQDTLSLFPDLNAADSKDDDITKVIPQTNKESR